MDGLPEEFSMDLVNFSPPVEHETRVRSHAPKSFKTEHFAIVIINLFDLSAFWKPKTIRNLAPIGSCSTYPYSTTPFYLFRLWGIFFQPKICGGMIHDPAVALIEGKFSGKPTGPFHLQGCTNKDGTRSPISVSNEIQHPMHSIAKIQVPCVWGTKHQLVFLVFSPACVTGKVINSMIRLRLTNSKFLNQFIFSAVTEFCP